MKIFTTLALVAFAAMCSAQDTKPMDPEAIAKHQVEDLTKKLKLSDTQAQQLSQLLLVAGKETAGLRAQCQDIDTKINASYDRQMTEMLNSLTPEQKDAYNKARKEGDISFTNCGSAAGCATGAKTAGCAEGKADTKAGCCAGGKAHSEAKPAELAKPAQK